MMEDKFVLISGYQSEDPISIQFEEYGEDLEHLQQQMNILAKDTIKREVGDVFSKRLNFNIIYDQFLNSFEEFEPWSATIEEGKFSYNDDVIDEIEQSEMHLSDYEGALKIGVEPMKITVYFRDSNGRVYNYLYEIKQIN